MVPQGGERPKAIQVLCLCRPKTGPKCIPCSWALFPLALSLPGTNFQLTTFVVTTELRDVTRSCHWAERHACLGVSVACKRVCHEAARRRAKTSSTGTGCRSASWLTRHQCGVSVTRILDKAYQVCTESVSQISGFRFSRPRDVYPDPEENRGWSGGLYTTGSLDVSVTQREDYTMNALVASISATHERS